MNIQYTLSHRANESFNMKHRTKSCNVERTLHIVRILFQKHRTKGYNTFPTKHNQVKLHPAADSSSHIASIGRNLQR